MRSSILCYRMEVNLSKEPQMKIPITDTLEKSWEELDTFKPLVIEEIYRLSSTQSYPHLELKRTKENGLDKLSRLELFEVTRRLSLDEKCLNIEDKRNYPKRVLRDERLKNSDFRADSDFITIQPNENEPIHLLLIDFKNWYTAYTLKKNLNFNDLSQINKEKILNLISDIDEKFEIHHSPNITINTDSSHYDEFPILRVKVMANTQIRNEFREDALNFLVKQEVISSYSMDNGNEKIQLVLNVSNYIKFRDSTRTIDLLPIMKSLEKKRALDRKERLVEKELQIQTNKTKPKDAIYQVEFTKNNEIFINDFLLQKPHFGNENAKVFRYLIENPNQIITRAVLQAKVGTVGKDFRKIVENLGFTGNYQRLFFQISKDNSILFRNPITSNDLQDLKISHLTLKIK